MKRCSKCGHTKFSAHQRICTDIIVDGDNQFLKNNSSDNSVSIYEQEAPYGPYSCKLCGAEYSSLEDLAEDNSRYVGYIYYKDSNERIGYEREEDLIRQFLEAIEYRGPSAQRVDGISDNNFSLKYQIDQIIYGEFGYEETPFDSWLKSYKKHICKKQESAKYDN